MSSLNIVTVAEFLTLPVHNASMSCTVGGVYPAASHCVPLVIAGGPGKRAGE